MATPTALWVAPVPEIGGVGRQFIDVARAGIPGWATVFAAPEGQLTAQLRADGAAVQALEIGPEVNPATATARLGRLIREVAPQVLHSHLPRADLLATSASVGAPVSLVTTEHTITPNRLVYHSPGKGAVMERLHGARLRRFAAVIAVSQATRNTIRRRWGAHSPIDVIYNGVDRPQPVTRRPGTRFLSLSRLSPEKNIHQTLRAFALITPTTPQATLTVAGVGPLRHELEVLAESLGIMGKVAFRGFVDSSGAIANHDVIIQPSEAENLSYSLLDAAAHGLGIATTRAGGNPEFLPEHCMVSAENAAALALTAVDQAQHVERRPTLPDIIPTVAGMASAIAAIYDGLGKR